jgi:hypothetical protein
VAIPARRRDVLTALASSDFSHRLKTWVNALPYVSRDSIGTPARGLLASTSRLIVPSIQASVSAENTPGIFR